MNELENIPPTMDAFLLLLIHSEVLEDKIKAIWKSEARREEMMFDIKSGEISWRMTWLAFT